MIIFGLMVFYFLIFMYIFARAEAGEYGSKNPQKTIRKAYHFVNLWITGLNIILGYSVYVTSFWNADDGRREGLIMILALILCFTSMYQIFITLRFIFSVGGKIVNYFTERD